MTILIKGWKRNNNEIGSASSRRLRRQGYIPGVIYAQGRVYSHIKLNLTDVYSTFNKLLNSEKKELILEIENEKYLAKVKEVSLDPVTDKPIHIDFLCLQSLSQEQEQM